MIVRGIRWDYSKESTEKRPEANNVVVELFVTYDNRSFFVSSSQHSDYINDKVTSFSIIDLITGLNYEEINQDYEIDKISDIVYEAYDFKENEVPGEISESDFYEAFKLSHLVRQTALPQSAENVEKVKGLIQEWLGRDLTEITV